MGLDLFHDNYIDEIFKIQTTFFSIGINKSKIIVKRYIINPLYI